MLRINVHSSSDAAKSYFDRELKCGDYYANDQEAPGQWGGMLATSAARSASDRFRRSLKVASRTRRSASVTPSAFMIKRTMGSFNTSSRAGSRRIFASMISSHRVLGKGPVAAPAVSGTSAWTRRLPHYKHQGNIVPLACTDFLSGKNPYPTPITH